MTTSTPAYLLNSIEMDFDSVFILEDESIKEFFRLVEVSGLKKFHSASSQEIYSYELLCIYENISINDNENIAMTVHDHTLLVDEEFFISIPTAF